VQSGPDAPRIHRAQRAGVASGPGACAARRGGRSGSSSRPRTPCGARRGSATSPAAELGDPPYRERIRRHPRSLRRLGPVTHAVTAQSWSKTSPQALSVANAGITVVANTEVRSGDGTATHQMTRPVRVPEGSASTRTASTRAPSNEIAVPRSKMFVRVWWSPGVRGPALWRPCRSAQQPRADPGRARRRPDVPRPSQGLESRHERLGRDNQRAPIRQSQFGSVGLFERPRRRVRGGLPWRQPVERRHVEKVDD
jgi:hypothetical protein